METSTNSRILLVDDEEGIRLTLSTLLGNEGYLVDVAANHVDAIVCLQVARYDLAFVDIKLDGDSGIAVLGDIKAISPATQVVMFTGRPEVETAAEAVRLGAFDYITKPVERELFLSITRLALAAKKSLDDQELYQANLSAIFRSIADSIVMVDRDGCLAQFNIKAGNICGYTSEMIGKEMEEIDTGCSGICRTTILQTLHSHAPKELRRFECHRPGRKNFIVSLSVTPVIEANGSLNGAVAVIRDETRLTELEQSLPHRTMFHGIVGASAPMQRIYHLVEALAETPTTALIYGESGTGKELISAALHYAGVRAARPFVKVSCSALPESLLESELFGHVRGAFTGAITDKIGRFQKADGGTLFLDEIGDISPAVQVRLLRVLQEREFEKVGDSTSIKVDVRFIAATNKDLAEMVKQGTFREDLYYRLDVFRLVIPPLRARLDDIELLVAHFIKKFNKKLAKNIQDVSVDTMNILHHYAWPGNVRELEHTIEYASVLCKTNAICVCDLPQDLITSVNVSSASADPPLLQNKPTLEEALVLASGNKTNAAKLLGISRRTLYRHLEERYKQVTEDN